MIEELFESQSQKTPPDNTEFSITQTESARREIWEMKKDAAADSHIQTLNPDRLTEEDLTIYKKFRAGEFEDTESPEFKAYWEDVNEKDSANIKIGKFDESQENNSSVQLAAYMRNQIFYSAWERSRIKSGKPIKKEEMH